MHVRWGGKNVCVLKARWWKTAYYLYLCVCVCMYASLYVFTGKKRRPHGSSKQIQRYSQVDLVRHFYRLQCLGEKLTKDQVKSECSRVALWWCTSTTVGYQLLQKFTGQHLRMIKEEFAEQLCAKAQLQLKKKQAPNMKIKEKQPKIN